MENDYSEVEENDDVDENIYRMWDSFSPEEREMVYTYSKGLMDAKRTEEAEFNLEWIKAYLVPQLRKIARRVSGTLDIQESKTYLSVQITVESVMALGEFDYLQSWKNAVFSCDDFCIEIDEKTGNIVIDLDYRWGR